MAEEYLNINPVPPAPENEPGREIKLPEPNRFGAFLKNLLTFLLLLLVVIASFWVSFQLGRRILMPAKKLPGPPVIEAPVPETPESIKALQRLQAAISGESQKKTAVKAKLVSRQIVRKPVCRRARSGYYKVQAGWFTDRSLASDLSGRVKAAGFETYVRKVNGGWRVQAGAFWTRKKAEALRQQLIAKGFKPQVIFE
ncbi:MAG: SPOR domain-containing protein [Candidatus Margulisbacteria bacterium]|jgi:cell division septation protein DedD|nr:SPOR domain-containing protein [Candidatus Margulisiibacteriota bacterium]